MFKIHIVILIALFSFGASAGYAQDKPVIFNSNEAVRPGEAFNLQGSGFGENAELWMSLVKGNEKELTPSFPVEVIGRSGNSITGVLPGNAKTGQNDLIAVWVKNGNTLSNPVYLNRARAVTLEFEEIMPGYVFRVFGRNLFLPGCNPVVTFIPLENGVPRQASVLDVDTYVLTVKAPDDLQPGIRYKIVVNNGAGGEYGNSIADETLLARQRSVDPFSLGVPWGSDFVFYKNVYNVKSDTRLSGKAKGDGKSNDRIVLQEAMDKAHADGGGVVYLPAGTYKLEFEKGSGLIMKSNVVLKGDGPEKTIIQYGFGNPPAYPDPIGVGGWPDQTTEGVALLWPLHTKLSGLSDLKIQNVNTTGLWRHSLKTMGPAPEEKAPGASGSRFFAKNCHFDLSVAWGLSWGYVDKMLVSDCNFKSYANITWPWMWHCDGSTNFVIRNNRVFYCAGRFGFSNGYNGIIENNHITRLGDMQPFRGETGGFNIDFTRDMVVMKNVMDVEGDSILDRNMGETILSQGGNPVGQSLGMLEEASETSVTDNELKWDIIRTSDLSTCSVLAIVSGKGAGQWRRIVKNNKNTIYVDRLWDRIPEKGSNYVITQWSAEDWLVKDNILRENNRGIWFYCGGTDVAIVGNELENSEGIYLRSDQRVEVGRYNLMWNAIVDGNTVSRNGRKRPAHICSVLAVQKNDTLIGMGSLGIEIRRNRIVTTKPNVNSFILGEGYWNEVRTTTEEALNEVTGIVGTIFDGNRATNTENTYRLSRKGITQTVIKDPVCQDCNVVMDELVAITSGTVTYTTRKKKDQDLFQPYLTGLAPHICKELGTETENGVSLRKFVFHSREYDSPSGKDSTEIFGVIARPSVPGKYPGLLILHGGGGSAEVEKAKLWAARGYVVVAVDEPGVANTKNTPWSKGPWDQYKYGEHRFVADPDITSSTIFDAVLASVQALYLLHAQPDVIPNKIGVVGISWGGYLTTMVTGLASPLIAASYSVFGSGFYDASSVFLKELDTMQPEHRALWLKWLDAGRRARGVRKPFFIAAATNDNWFYPQAVKNTLQHIGAPVNHVFSPNVSHKIASPGGTENKKPGTPGWTSMEEIYFDYYLKGKGKRFPKIQTIHLEKTGKNTVQVQFTVNAETPIKQAEVSYAVVGVTPTKRNWITVPARRIKKNVYAVEVDLQDMPSSAVEFFGTVSDDRPVSVSSYMIWYTNR
ncbi:glycosyl hydrolase family 28-related protein [Parabacteroides pacaensis]|uniref:glycosyl hydrolase family 28-related protein n=1 Tax=Parabacteroides pacaensis TaxID=2086575 RepID=UPI00131ECE3A|nr:glycosyl hydrolase family 28-related protein [Parabacteroides pacaensis]